MQEYRKAGCSKHGVCEHKVVVVCEKCTAEKCGTQSTDTQQLKAKIAAKCNHALNPSYAFSKEQLFDMFRELRKLSAV